MALMKPVFDWFWLTLTHCEVLTPYWSFTIVKKMLLYYCFDLFCACRVQWTLVIDLSLGVPPTIQPLVYKVPIFWLFKVESGIPYVFQTWFFFPGFCLLLLLFPISLAVWWKLSTKVLSHPSFPRQICGIALIWSKSSHIPIFLHGIPWRRYHHPLSLPGN